MAERHRHRRTTRELADDEAPPGDESPERAQSFAAVDISTARLGVHRGELRRRGCIAIGDQTGNREPNEKAISRSTGSRTECSEHTRTDHRPESDHDGVAGLQSSREPGGNGVGHARLVVDLRVQRVPVARASDSTVRNASRNRRRRHFRARPHEEHGPTEPPDDRLVLQEDLLARAEEQVARTIWRSDDARPSVVDKARSRN